MKAETHKVSTRTLIVLGLFSFLTSLAGSSINLALPKISLDLNISNSMSTWVVQAGLIGTTCLLVLFGHMGDLFSKDYVFINGGSIFLIGSAINRFAPNFTVLICGRVVQSIGIAMIMANSMGIVTESFDEQHRAEALSTISVFISAGAISGPAVGGFVLSVLSWRWIFLLNVPIGLVVLLFGCKALPIPKESWQNIKSQLKVANWTGQILFTIGVIIFFLSSSFFTAANHNYLMGLGFLLVGLVITIFAFVQDDFSKSPWIDPSIARNEAFLVSISALFLVNLVNAISNILLPFYLQSFAGYSAFASGLIMIGQPAAMILVTPITGYLADRMNRNLLTMFGLIVLLLSQIGYATYSQNSGLINILVPIIANGVGMAMFLSPNNAITMGTVDKSLSGVAGSFNSFARTFGMTIGISAASVMLFAQLPGVQHITPALGSSFVRAFSISFIVGALISVVALLIVTYRYWSSHKMARRIR